MTRIIRWLPAVALSMGPLAAYLVWAITRKKWAHAGVAAIANIILWLVGPMLLAWEISLLH